MTQNYGRLAGESYGGYGSVRHAAGRYIVYLVIFAAVITVTMVSIFLTLGGHRISEQQSSPPPSPSEPGGQPSSQQAAAKAENLVGSLNSTSHILDNVDQLVG
jgi:hypothetical protein